MFVVIVLMVMVLSHTVSPALDLLGKVLTKILNAYKERCHFDLPGDFALW